MFNRETILVEKEIQEIQPVRTSIHKHFFVRKNDMVVYGLGLILHYKIFSDATFFCRFALLRFHKLRFWPSVVNFLFDF